MVKVSLFETILGWKGVQYVLDISCLFDLFVDSSIIVAETRRLGWGVEDRCWRWRRRLFSWEEELVVERCSLLDNIVLHESILDTWS